MSIRPSLDQIGVSAGKKARLYRILYQHGLRNGTAILGPWSLG
jgi:class I fructose-bisphosphate aldolase